MLQTNINTLADAAHLAQSLEPIAIEFGFHVAVGGSCLYNGYSLKDIDILIYKHKPDAPSRIGEFLNALTSQSQLHSITPLGNSRFEGAREVYSATWLQSKRVDLIFL